MPIAAKVPRTVETMLAMTAIIIVFISELIISLLWKSLLYQSKVKPLNTLLLFVSLNENTMRTNIGTYRKSITRTRYIFPSFFNVFPSLHKHLIVRIELVHYSHYNKYYHHENERYSRSEVRIIGISEELHLDEVAYEKI